MGKRYMHMDLTGPERFTQREQGKEIGPTVNEQPLRIMTAPQLRELLFELVRDSEGSKRKHWYTRQRKKVEAELQRRRT